MSYGCDNNGRLTWVPPGWGHTPPHVLGPSEPKEKRDERAKAHAYRVADRRRTEPKDWPPFLLSYAFHRPLPWRLVRIGKMRLVSWHATRQEALDAGNRV